MEEPVIGWGEALGAAATNPEQPSTTGETIFALGETWTVSTFENGMKAQFEKWVRAGAVEAVAEQEQEGNLEFAQLMMDSYVKQRAAKAFVWDGSACRAAKKDKPGLVYLLFLMLRRCQPKVTEDTARKIFDTVPEQAGMAIGWSLGNAAALEDRAKTATFDSP